MKRDRPFPQHQYGRTQGYPWTHLSESVSLAQIIQTANTLQGKPLSPPPHTFHNHIMGLKCMLHTVCVICMLIVSVQQFKFTCTLFHIYAFSRQVEWNSVVMLRWLFKISDTFLLLNWLIQNYIALLSSQTSFNKYNHGFRPRAHKARGTINIRRAVYPTSPC